MNFNPWVCAFFIEIIGAFIGFAIGNIPMGYAGISMLFMTGVGYVIAKN